MQQKGVIFTCLNTPAVHLKLTGDKFKILDQIKMSSF